MKELPIEYRELLFKDLCARLQHGVYITWDGKNPISATPSIYNAIWLKQDFKWKSYLRPMSSMTEEEKQELLKVTSLIEYDEDWETLKSIDFYGDARLDVGMEIWLKAFDWLNKKMFAYRTYNDKNMFELGLAIPAPEGMYQ